MRPFPDYDIAHAQPEGFTVADRPTVARAKLAYYGWLMSEEAATADKIRLLDLGKYIIESLERITR